MTLKLSYLPSLESLELVEWIWPQGQSLIFFDEILNHQNSLPNFVTEQGKYLSIEHSVLGETEAWWLQNQVQDLVCVVNGHTLKPGLKQRLAHGDVFEFGFSRFDVSLDETRSSAVESDCSEHTEFELADLAGDDKSLDFLLSEDIHAVKQHAVATNQTDEVANADVFARLHAQYLRRLENPWRTSDPETSWLNVQRGEQKDTFDPMQALMAQAGMRAGLTDLLGESEQIESVMHSLDTHETQNILAPETYPSVMRLFAPIGFQEGEGQADSTHGVPGLTQREHHSVSLDSVISTNLKTSKYD